MYEQVDGQTDRRMDGRSVCQPVHPSVLHSLIFFITSAIGAEPSAGFNFNIAMHGDHDEEVSNLFFFSVFTRTN
jgi:hypothetical protein